MYRRHKTNSIYRTVITNSKKVEGKINQTQRIRRYNKQVEMIKTSKRLSNATYGRDRTNTNSRTDKTQRTKGTHRRIKKMEHIELVQLLEHVEYVDDTFK